MMLKMLKITSNDACLVQAKARCRTAAHFHLSRLNNNRTNGLLDAPCKAIKNVVSSGAKAKTGGTCLGGKHTCLMHAALQELGHLQPATRSPFETDNSTAQGILNSKMCQKLSKSFDMRCWWMKDRINKGQFNLIWAPRKFNLADCFTKHHLPWHHRQMCCNYLQKLNSARGTIQGALVPRMHVESNPH
jgi:hypothetical protein